MSSVSPRMLYNFARRYDEYDGEDYDGSSCRGALKGWFNNGVCLEEDWPYAAGANPAAVRLCRPRRLEHTLGVYYRIDPSHHRHAGGHPGSGAVYRLGLTHDGWDDVPRRSRQPPAHMPTCR